MSSNKEYLPYLARVYSLPTYGSDREVVEELRTEYLQELKEAIADGSFVVHKELDCRPEDTLTANLWVEVIEYELARRAPKRGIWWLVVGEEELHPLATFLVYSPNLEEVEHLHVTLAFDATEEEVPSLCNGGWESSSFPIRVKGLAYNSRCACLVVDIGDTDCCNKHPHITLALAEGVQPVYSNDMLAGKDGP